MIPLVIVCWFGCVSVCKPDCPSRRCVKCDKPGFALFDTDPKSSKCSVHPHRFCEDHIPKNLSGRVDFSKCLINKCTHYNCGNRPIQPIMGKNNAQYVFCYEHQIKGANADVKSAYDSTKRHNMCIYCNRIARYTSEKGTITFICEVHKDENHKNIRPEKKKGAKRVRKVKPTANEKLMSLIKKQITEINALDNNITRSLNTGIFGEPIRHKRMCK
jgi:hypothetical protein